MRRIDESIEKMYGFIKEIEIKTIEQGLKLNDDEKLQVKAIADKTVNTINSSIVKLQEMKEQVSDDSQLEDFLSRLDKKCEDVTAYTIMKIDEIKPVIKETTVNLKEDLEKTFDEFKTDVKEVIEDNKENIEEAKQDIQENVEELKENIKENVDDAKEELDDSIEKILENENVKNIIKFVKDTKEKAVEIYNMPETQEAINRAKLKIIDIAEKGLDTLKVILEKESEPKNDNSENI